MYYVNIKNMYVNINIDIDIRYICMNICLYLIRNTLTQNRVGAAVGELGSKTFPETNSEFTPENGWLEYDPASFWGLAYFQVLC